MRQACAPGRRGGREPCRHLPAGHLGCEGRSLGGSKECRPIASVTSPRVPGTEPLRRHLVLPSRLPGRIGHPPPASWTSDAFQAPREVTRSALAARSRSFDPFRRWSPVHSVAELSKCRTHQRQRKRAVCDRFQLSIQPMQFLAVTGGFGFERFTALRNVGTLVTKAVVALAEACGCAVQFCPHAGSLLPCGIELLVCLVQLGFELSYGFPIRFPGSTNLLSPLKNMKIGSQPIH